MSDAQQTHGQMRPHIKVSIVLITFQQELFVRESLESLMNQDWPELQIVVSDDASKDRTWEIVQETARLAGPHVRMVLNRNETNLGIIGNYNKAVSLCDGDLIFSAAGDDVSEVDRISKCVELWASGGQKIDLIATDLADMDIDGQILGVKPIDDLHVWTWRRWMKQRPYHVGASHMVTRRLLAVRPLNEKAKLEDQCLLFRSLLMGGAMRVPKILVRHRRGGVSNGGEVKKTYATKRDMLLVSANQAIHEVEQYLSDARILKAPVELVTHLNQLHRSSLFTVQCLLAKSSRTRFCLMHEYTDVAIRTRMRFFLFSSLGPVYSIAYILKSIMKN